MKKAMALLGSNAVAVLAMGLMSIFLVSCHKDGNSNDCRPKEYWNGRCWNVYNINDSLVLCIPQFEGATPKFLTISEAEREPQVPGQDQVEDEMVED